MYTHTHARARTHTHIYIYANEKKNANLGEKYIVDGVRARRNVNRIERILLIPRINGFHSLTPECTSARSNPDFKLDDARAWKTMRKKGRSREMRNQAGKTDDRFGGAEGVLANRAFNFHDHIRPPTRRQSERRKRNGRYSI